MWKVPKWMYLIVIIPFLAVGIGMIFFEYQASPEALTDDSYPLKEFLYMMGAFFIILPFISAVGLMIFYKRINDREKNLIEHGLQGEAEILSREQTGVYINELPQVKFLLKITSTEKHTKWNIKTL